MPVAGKDIATDAFAGDFCFCVLNSLKAQILYNQEKVIIFVSIE